MYLKILFISSLTLLAFLLLSETNPLYKNPVRFGDKVQNIGEIKLLPQKGFNETGVAEILEVNGNIVINIRLENFPKNIRQTAFFMEGGCDDLGKVEYYIAPAMNGQSTSTYYGYSANRLVQSKPMSIVITKSENEPGVIYSCGEWK